jgi:hypothetical protein
MKSKLINKVILIFAVFLGFSLSICAQVNSIYLSWDDQCLPAVNMTDHYYARVEIFRNIDNAPLCGIGTWEQDFINYNQPYYEWGGLENCYCTDAQYGYHVVITVERHTWDHIKICDGGDDFNCNCSRLEPFNEKVILQ